MRQPTGRWVLTGLLAAAAFAPVTSFAADPEVRFEADRLWIRTQGKVALPELLQAITEKTEVEFLIDPELADAAIDVELEGMPLEEVLRRLVREIREAGGHTMSYVEDASGKARVSRVMVFGAGKAPAGDPAAVVESGMAEAVVVKAPTPSEREVEQQKANLVELGVAEETAREFVDFIRDMPRLQRTPGAMEELIRSKRYQEIMREIGKAQGKGIPPDQAP